MTCRVAIADDAPDVRMLLRTVLEEEGFVVVGEARNGAEAVEVARSEKPDVFLLDLSMPVMDGLEALPQIVADSPAVAVIVLSGFVNDEVRTRVEALGASGCLEKGTDLSALIDGVRQACAGAGVESPGASTAGTAAGASPGGSDGPGTTPAPAPVAGEGPPTAPPNRPGGTRASRPGADDLVPMLVHELNPPVSLLARALDQARLAAETGTGDVAGALDTAERAAADVREMLDAFRMAAEADSGRLEVRPDAVDLGDLVREAVSDLAPMLGDDRVSVAVEGEVVARVDAARVRQILANLLSNAAKFSADAAPIEVEVSTENGTARIAVRDRGKGVPTEAADAIFEKYVRVGDTPGMGLGLYVARALAASHGGAIRLEHPDDGGSRFVVTLPRA